MTNTLAAQQPAAAVHADRALLPISVLIPVKNEQGNLPGALASVAWSNDIVVVDSQSTDATQEVSEQAGARVIQFHYQPGGPRKKNWSLDNVDFRNEWILLLDADERVSPELYEELRVMMQHAEQIDCDGYYVNRRLIFLGKWIRHCGWYPSWNMRFVRRGAAHFEKPKAAIVNDRSDVEIHEHMIVHSGKAGYLKQDLLHEDTRDLFGFLAKHNRYSNWDSQIYLQTASGRSASGEQLRARWFGEPLERKRAMKRLWVHLPFRPTLRFLWMYVVKRGFLDGMPGYIFCRLMAQHEFHIWAKIWEAQNAPPPKQEG